MRALVSLMILIFSFYIIAYILWGSSLEPTTVVKNEGGQISVTMEPHRLALLFAPLDWLNNQLSDGGIQQTATRASNTGGAGPGCIPESYQGMWRVRSGGSKLGNELRSRFRFEVKSDRVIAHFPRGPRPSETMFVDECRDGEVIAGDSRIYMQGNTLVSESPQSTINLTRE